MTRLKKDSEELLDFVRKVLEHNQIVPYKEKFTSEACWALIKYVIDGEQPVYEPSSYYALEDIFRLYYLVPERFKDDALVLISQWKTKCTTDPDIYKTEVTQASV